MPLIDEEVALAARIGFDTDILELAKQASGNPITQTVRVNYDDDEVSADGIATQLSSDQVEAFVKKHQTDLTKRSYRAFWSDGESINDLESGDALVILKTTDPYDIIRFNETDGANYGVETDDIIARLKAWSSISRFEITGAAPAWVAILFQSLPQDICAFAKEVYEFCPDSVEQGSGLHDELDEPEVFAGARELWAKNANDPDSGEIGLKLLAYDIYSSKTVFLWWD